MVIEGLLYGILEHKDGVFFKFLSVHGLKFCKLIMKGKINKNLFRIKNFLMCEVTFINKSFLEDGLGLAVRIVENNNLFSLIDNDALIKKLDNALYSLQEFSVNEVKEFLYIVELLTDATKETLPKLIMISIIIIYKIIMSQHNLIINTEKCYFCKRETDIYCYSSSLWSFICYSCWLQNKNSLKEDILLGKRNLLLLERISKERNYEYLLDVDMKQFRLIIAFIRNSLRYSLHTDI